MPPLVNADHLKKLHVERSIALALIQQRGYQSLPQPEDLIDRGFSKAQARTAPALGIPLWDVHGQQARLANPARECRGNSPMGSSASMRRPKAAGSASMCIPRVQPLLGDPTRAAVDYGGRPQRRCLGVPWRLHDCPHGRRLGLQGHQ